MTKTKLWYESLCFKLDTEERHDNVLEVQTNVGTKKKDVVWTGVKPVFGFYYHPSNPCHPYVDRLCLVRSSIDNAECMVRYQDKVNQSDFPKACRHLERAANKLQDETGIKEALLVVNVIGASPQTRAQKNLTKPFIREDGVEPFYSRNFAVSMVHLFARERHLLSISA